MKKAALFLALLMIVSQAYGWCYTATVDNLLDEKSKSDLHPVQDTAKMAGAINEGVNKALLETQPMSTLMTPVETVRKESLKGVNTITNTIWDALTLRSFREKKK